jgi:hypothetical protein
LEVAGSLVAPNAKKARLPFSSAIGMPIISERSGAG